MMNFEETIEYLREGVKVVTFIKKNGEHRYMRCTKNLDLVPTEAHPKNPTKNGEDLPIRVFDIDKQGWRSFKFDQLISAGEDDDEN